MFLVRRGETIIRPHPLYVFKRTRINSGIRSGLFAIGGESGGNSAPGP